jgi:hypothetical protein
VPGVNDKSSTHLFNKCEADCWMQTTNHCNMSKLQDTKSLNPFVKTCDCAILHMSALQVVPCQDSPKLGSAASLG